MLAWWMDQNTNYGLAVRVALIGQINNYKDLDMVTNLDLVFYGSYSK